MTRRCECLPNSLTLCGWCDAAVARVEEAELFDYGWVEADLDAMADAMAARDWAARGGAA